MARGCDLEWRDGALYHPDGRLVQPGELRGGESRLERDFGAVEGEPQDVDERQTPLFEEKK